jgi:hypothetical protein
MTVFIFLIAAMYVFAGYVLLLDFFNGIHQFSTQTLSDPVTFVIAVIIVCFTFMFLSFFRGRRGVSRKGERLSGPSGVETTDNRNYFLLRPYGREDYERFRRPDCIGDVILSDIREKKFNIYYVCGKEGVGKTSIINAFIVPKLEKEDDEQSWKILCYSDFFSFCEAVNSWRRDGRIEYCQIKRQHCENDERLLFIIDDFDLFVFVDLARWSDFQFIVDFINQAASDSDVSFLIVMRDEFFGELRDLEDSDGNPLLVEDNHENRYTVEAFSGRHSTEFMSGSGSGLSREGSDLVADYLFTIEQSDHIRPFLLNLAGLIISKKPSFYSDDVNNLIYRYIKDSMNDKTVQKFSYRILKKLVSDYNSGTISNIDYLESRTKIEKDDILRTLYFLRARGIVKQFHENNNYWAINNDVIAGIVKKVVNLQMFSPKNNLNLMLHASIFLLVLFVLFERASPIDRSNIFMPQLVSEMGIHIVGTYSESSSCKDKLKGGPYKFVACIGRVSAEDDGIWNAIDLILDIELNAVVFYGGFESNDVATRSIQMLGSIRTIKEIYITGDNFYDLAALADIKSLNAITLDSTGAKDLSPLTALKWLTYLHIYRTDIANYSPLLKMPVLIKLDAPGARIDSQILQQLAEKDVEIQGQSGSLDPLDLMR